MFGTQRDGLAEAVRGFLGTVQAIEQDAEIGVRIHMVWTQADRRAVGGLGSLRTARGPQQDAEIAVRGGVAGIEFNGAFVLGNRVAESATGLQNDSKIAVPVRLIRAECETLPDEVDGFIGSALLVRQQAAVVKGVRMLRRHVEHACIQLFRLGQVVLLLQQNRQRDGLVDRQRPRLRRFHRYPTLLACRSNLKCNPSSSDPSDRCGLYSRSTLANFRLTDSAYGWSSPPAWVTAVIVTSFSLMMRNCCCPWPALRWVIVASLMCCPVAQALRS